MHPANHEGVTDSSTHRSCHTCICMCKGEASIHHGPVALRIPALQEPADLNIHLSAPTHVLKQKAQSVEAAFSQLPPLCSGVCSRHTQAGILAVRCIDYKPPPSIITAGFDCWVCSRAWICWCDYQYTRFLVRLVQPSYGTLHFPAAIFRIVRINSLRCSVPSHSKTDAISEFPKYLSPHPPSSAFHGTTCRKQ